MDYSLPKISATEEERQPSVASTVLLSENMGNEEPKGASSSTERGISLQHEGSRHLTSPLPELPSVDRRLESLASSMDPGDYALHPIFQEIDSDVTITGNDDALFGFGDDTASVAESVKSVTGKRRHQRDPDDSSDDNSDIGTHRLRHRKTRILDSSLDENKGGLPETVVAPSSPPKMSICEDEESPAQLESESEDATKKKRVIKKKVSPIAHRIHTLVDDVHLKGYTTSSLVAHAMDWIDDIELIRKRSNWQGVISKHVKERLDIIRDIFRVMHDQSLMADDPGRLKLRNARMAADLNAIQQENAHLKEDITNLRKEIQKMKITFAKLPRARHREESPVLHIEEEKSNVITSNLPVGIEDEIASLKNRISLLESCSWKSDIPVGSDSIEPLPQRKPKSKPAIKSIVEINPPRKVTILTNTVDPGPSYDVGPRHVAAPDNGPGDPTGLGPVPGPSLGPGPGPGEDPDVCDDPVPETKKKKVTKGSDTDGYKSMDNTSKDESSGHWKIVEKKKKKTKKKKKQEGQKQEDNLVKDKGREKKVTEGEGKRSFAQVTATPPSKTKSVMQILKKKVPKTSAVIITGKSKDFSYADALIKLRKEIPLEEIGIHTTRIKKAVSGAVLIEIPGGDNKKLAEELRSRAEQVLGEEASVTRPEVKGEIRVIGFDESVVASDISACIAKAGECNASEILVTPIIPMRNGLYMTWVRCPLSAALKAAKDGKIALGWTIAKLELQKPRTLRCFRCWQTGHHQRFCNSLIDRSKSCFRCGNIGHLAASCEGEAHCILCESKGLSPRHRIGSYRCNINTEVEVDSNLEATPEKMVVDNKEDENGSYEPRLMKLAKYKLSRLKGADRCRSALA